MSSSSGVGSDIELPTVGAAGSNKVAAPGTYESQSEAASVSVLATSNIIGRIEALQLALRTNLPNYESMLQTIHRMLAEDDSLVHILTEDQIGVICSGLKKKKDIVIVKEASKKNTTKKLSQTTLADI